LDIKKRGGRKTASLCLGSSLVREPLGDTSSYFFAGAAGAATAFAGAASAFFSAFFAAFFATFASAFTSTFAAGAFTSTFAAGAFTSTFATGAGAAALGASAAIAVTANKKTTQIANANFFILLPPAFSFFYMRKPLRA
jgi:hypothetical protein